MKQISGRAGDLALEVPSLEPLLLTHRRQGPQPLGETKADGEGERMLVGEKVFIAHPVGWATRYTEATVVKVTPSGMADVQVGTNAPVRFNARGRGMTRYFEHDYLDTIPHAERVHLLEREKRERAAADALRAVTVKDGVNHCWGKDGMQSEVVRLQALLDAAKLAVEAI